MFTASRDAIKTTVEKHITQMLTTILPLPKVWQKRYSRKRITSAWLRQTHKRRNQVRWSRQKRAKGRQTKWDSFDLANLGSVISTRTDELSLAYRQHMARDCEIRDRLRSLGIDEGVYVPYNLLDEAGEEKTICQGTSGLFEFLSTQHFTSKWSSSCRLPAKQVHQSIVSSKFLAIIVEYCDANDAVNERACGRREECGREGARLQRRRT